MRSSHLSVSGVLMFLGACPEPARIPSHEPNATATELLISAVRAAADEDVVLVATNDLDVPDSRDTVLIRCAATGRTDRTTWGLHKAPAKPRWDAGRFVVA